MSWRVSAQITILNMPFHMKSVQMYWKVLNMEMNLWQLAIHINILNISKDCQRICGNFIFTAVRRECSGAEAALNQERQFNKSSSSRTHRLGQSFTVGKTLV
jgi:hypothetical protein